MIRFRIGQRWKREQQAGAPKDSFGLDLDGVDLLAEAGDESLAKVVPELVEAACALVVRGDPFAQLSLPEAHLELCFHRDESEVELFVVSMARPARLLRPPVRVEASELSDAAMRCGKSLLEDLAEAAPK